MSYSAMPMAPVDAILGPFPRYYLIGEKAVPAEVVEREPSGAIAAMPVQLPKDLTQESVLEYTLNSQGVKLINGIPYENIKIQKHTEESRQQYISKIRRVLYTDIIENGIPVESAPDLVSFSYTFQKKQYTFKTEDLRMFDLLQYPSDIKNGIRPTGIPNIFNLAERPMYLPCEKDGKLQIFTAQHLSGTELFQEYVNMRVRYIELYNQLIQYINDYVFDKDHTVSVLWNVIYGHTNFYGQVERIKIAWF